ncbi:DNA adenine methylase [Granulicella cerasi]|uniref:site-specific DNA-methyltransferase (adenine-specific) n=1 Tax=Granulicella cerasi TaxID=741063 RepID=A0ABW1Z7Y4_9BACT|nr:DNA adenine methylase [Granulicella cerasi]
MNAAFAWPGGKRALVPTLLKLLPSDHSLYCEVFAGSAKLLFAKEPSRREVINDLNGDVTNFFRVVKHAGCELAERLEAECIHSGRFRELREAAPPSCEIDRALRFAYLTWYSFSAKGEHFASNKIGGKQLRSLASIRITLQRVAERLASVQIEQRDFIEILQRFDSRDTLFYLDPPYVDFGSNGRYEALTVEQRSALFSTIAQLKGRALVSFDDHAEIRNLAKQHGLQMRSAAMRYSLGGGHRAKDAPELLLANYPLAA